MAKESSRASKIMMFVSFGILALAVIGALVVFFLPANDEPAPGNSSAPAPAASSTPDATGIGCEAPPSDNREVPEDLRWAASQGITWPVSDSTGPTATVEGFPACFEHSPTGAALAAVSVLFSQIDQSPLESAEFYLADSPGKKAALSELTADSVSELKSQIETAGISVVGFKVEEYDGDRAMVRIVLRVPGSGSGFSGYPSPMVWTDGDWKLKPLDTGSTGQSAELSGGDFTYWTTAGNG